MVVLPRGASALRLKTAAMRMYVAQIVPQPCDNNMRKNKNLCTKNLCNAARSRAYCCFTGKS